MPSAVHDSWLPFPTGPDVEAAHADMNYEINEADQLELKIRTLEYKIEQLQSTSDEAVVVATRCGKVKGTKRISLYDHVFYSFERIPYAQPPVAQLRFRAPKPAAPWRDVRDCTNYGPKPVQVDVGGKTIGGSEDCLYLNVYTKSLCPDKPRPVMVWIYGGGFVFGEATREWYAPDYFMMRNIVLITVQYRLGALGFLSLSDPKLHTPGNAGLKDQILALKWIKRNCAAFGGNPDNITVFGESAGSMATTMLMVSEQARGLFHRAIAQSGSLNSSLPTATTEGKAYYLAKEAGYKGANEEQQVLKFLLSLPAPDIVEAEQRLLSKADKSQLIGFGPCIEPYVTHHTVFERPPMQLLSAAWGLSIPLMIGGTSNEGLFFLPTVKKSPQMVGALLETCTAYVPGNAAMPRDSPQLREQGLRLRELHVKGEKPTAEDLLELVSYAYFWNPMQMLIRSRLAQPKLAAPTYLYRFDFESPKQEHPFRLLRWGRGVAGVAHTDELAYLFRSVLSNRMPYNSREFVTLERMIGLWTAFAKHGNPNSKLVNGMHRVQWRPLRKADANWKCLNIGDELQFVDLPEMAKLKVWHEMNHTEHELLTHKQGVAKSSL